MRRRPAIAKLFITTAMFAKLKENYKPGYKKGNECNNRVARASGDVGNPTVTEHAYYYSNFLADVVEAEVRGVVLRCG